MSLFGTSTPQKPAFTFPTPAAAPATSTGGLFGNTTPSKPLFGSTTQASSTPSLFGSTTTSTPSGGLFGKTPSATTTTSSAGTLFGAAPAATSTTTPSLFGSTAATRPRVLRVHRLGGMSLFTRRDAIVRIDPADLPQNQPARPLPPAPTTSSPACRRLFASPPESKPPIPKSPLAATSSCQQSSSGIFAMPANPESSTSGVPAKIQAFRARSTERGSVATSIAALNSQASTSGAPAPTPAPTSNLFGATTATTPRTSSFGFGAKISTPSTSSNFLSVPTATPFGSSTNTATTGSSLFGSTSTAAKPAGGGLFGSSGTTLGGLGGGLGSAQQQQQQPVQQQQVIQQYHPFVKACGNPQITGNDNDKHIANLNQVAAALGVGKAPYKDGNQVQTFNMEGNVFEKFVGIGYNKISERTDDEGVVSLVLRHPIANLNTEERKAKILEVITTVLGNQQNIKVLFAPGTSLRALGDGCTEICIIVKEGGFVVGACKLAQVLNDGPRMTQLESQLAADKTRVLPKVGMSKAQKDRYLETVPDGIDERIWRQAIAANPAPNKLLPVAVRGWEALRDRQRAQVQETKIYHEAMHSLADRIEKAGVDHANAIVGMEQLRNRHKQLSYRLIRILLAQWITARFSRQIDTDEDQIEAKCDTLLAQINRNHQVKFYIDKFYEILETRPEQLQQAMLTMYDMKEEDQIYARRFLTAFVYACEQLINMSNFQVDELEAVRKALEG